MQLSKDSKDPSTFLVLSRLLFLALVIRTLVAWLGFGDLSGDPDAYARLARNLAISGTYGFESFGNEFAPTAFRPPLYPWLLSWLVWNGQLSLPAVASLHILLGVTTVGLTYLVGLRLRLHYAWLAAVAVTIDPLLLRGSQLVMTETLATFLAVLAWWLWLIGRSPNTPEACSPHLRSRHHWLAISGCSGVLGLSILARPTGAPWVFMCAILLLFFGCNCWKRRINDCAILGIAVLICIAPWTLRNFSYLGSPVWATTHGGYTLLLANNPSLYTHFSNNGPSRAWDPQHFHDAWARRFSIVDTNALTTDEYWLQPIASPPLDMTMTPGVYHEVVDDKLAYRAARSTIERRPAMFALSCLYRVTWLWALWPYDGAIGAKEWLIGGWYAVAFAIAIWGLGTILHTGSYREWMIAFALMISLTCVHSIYWSNMRMRSPAMPAVMLLAAAGLQSLPRRIKTSPMTIKTPPTI
jgi:4-amino-4-deoxy-L-arabinose transferase-like glycosyltransferase